MLHRVDENVNERAHGTGVKVALLKGSALFEPISALVARDEWEIGYEYNPVRYTLESETGQTYTSGYHMFPEIDAALWYWMEIAPEFHHYKPVIMRVEWSNQLARGITKLRSGRELITLVAGHMYISEAFDIEAADCAYLTDPSVPRPVRCGRPIVRYW